MKKEIHPKYFTDAEVTCICGEKYTAGATQKEVKVEICSKCHPFYTGEQRIVDTEGRVERMRRRYKVN
jgi:large subunit ribosomal protein L31